MVDLPSFRKPFARTLRSSKNPGIPSNDGSSLPAQIEKPKVSQIKRATRTRKRFSLLTSIFLFLSVVFLILVEIGQVSNSAVLRDVYFLKLDLQNVIPATVPNARLLNSIAQTLGLHDFYTVGLWGFCSGYYGTGVTSCSEPVKLYWFNPVEILRNELIAGATINLPGNINGVLNIIKIASNWMFGFFVLGAVLSTVLMFVMPFAVFSRWASLPIAFLALLNAVIISVASSIATAMFIIFRNVVRSVAELNIDSSVGNKMFAFMWTASGFASAAALIQVGLCCCCASRRDVKTGRKQGSMKAYTGAIEKLGGRKRFGRKSA